MEVISIYPSEEEKNIIRMASSEIGLKVAAFCKSVSLAEAKKIIGGINNGRMEKTEE